MAGGKLTGAFVPTTNVWDVSEVYGVKDLSPELRELLVRLYQNLNVMAQVLNIKDSGYYVLTDFVNGQKFFPNPALNSTTATQPTYRQVLRTVVNFGALPNAGTKSVAHGLPVNINYTFTRIYGCSTNPNTLFISLPYVYISAPGLGPVELWADPTNVNITTTVNLSAFTTTYIILEYITS
jgi:hypothetical protein